MEYRFGNLIGNGTTLQLIKNTLANKSFPNFSIFAGVMGTGKSTSAKAAALALTCSDVSPDRNKAFACCRCSNCMNAISSFTSTGLSNNIRIINIAEFTSIDDVKSMIKDIFVIQNGISNKVYILEEAHALKNIKGAEIALLEEIDRIPSNVYIIMCTTEESSIIKELKSRAILFNFQRLNVQESSLLLDRLLYQHKFSIQDANVKKLIIKNSNGIPRNIENVVEFIANSGATMEEIKDFLQVISDEMFIGLFSALKSNDISLTIQYLDSLCGSRSVKVIVSELKRFILSVLFYFEGGITDDFSKTERDSIKDLFSDSGKNGTDKVLNIASEIDKWGFQMDVNTFKLRFFGLRLQLQSRKLGNVFGGKETMARCEQQIGKDIRAELTTVDIQSEFKGLKRVNSKPVDTF